MAVIQQNFGEGTLKFRKGNYVIFGIKFPFTITGYTITATLSGKSFTVTKTTATEITLELSAADSAQVINGETWEVILEQGGKPRTFASGEFVSI